ncbi:MAG: OmpA family protein [Acidobacteria bacterium]|nr:OmpA family protein [Acidobacteriota bacterium]
MDLMKRALPTISAAVLVGAMVAPAYAQQSQDELSASSTQTTSAQTTDNSQYATGKPLEMQSKEGFWGHMNPFARKKWVKRQVNPIKDRVNELDEVQAKNANDIRDLDARTTAGIRRASDAAAAADQRAAEAGNRADAANGLATTASTRTQALHGTVSNLDQYQPVTAKSLTFAKGRTTLTERQKKELDEVADQLANEKGYIVEVQGYSRSGVTSSQAMADSVVRYLVTEHDVPIYRIYRTGMGRAKFQGEEGERSLTNGVHVAVLHNSLANMDNSTTGNTSDMPANNTQSSVTMPQSNY